MNIDESCFPGREILDPHHVMECQLGLGDTNHVDGSLSFLKDGEVDLGTSIMAVAYEGGVVMGADSRTSTGAYIANRVTDKITPIDEKIYVCRSGSAADTQAVSDYVTYYLDQHRIQYGQPPKVATAANLVRQMCYQNKNQLTAGMVVAGWDSTKGGQVYSIPIGGAMLERQFTIGGSGSSYIYGFCDAYFKPGMTKAQTQEFVCKALCHAMARDGSSGGVVRICTISESGVERTMVPGNKLPYGPL